MRKTLTALLALAAASPALAQHEGHDMGGMGGMGGMEMSAPAGAEAEQGPPQLPPPPAALEGPAHAADTVFDPARMAKARARFHSEMNMTTGKLMIDRLEYHVQDGKDGYAWEAQGWYGGDIDKLWLKSEGEGRFGEGPEQAEVQALWSHAIGPWFDLQTGVRYDFRPDPDRAHLVLGVEGLAPYMFELGAAAFLSTTGRLTARIEAEYDQRITQRLILQPRLEANLAAQDERARGVGAGLSSIELGARLRYEIVPEFAPYVGFEWEAKTGRSADFARADGERASGTRMVVGLRAWF